jgi:CRP-like cAMP-binding protein
MQIQNHLLSSLTETDRTALQPHLEAVELPVRYVLEVPNKPLSHAYFLESGIGSVVTGDGAHDEIETGIVGRDGMTGTAIVLIAAQCPSKTFMQIGGKGWRIEAPTLLARLHESPSMHHCFLRYAFSFSVQTANTVLSNAKAKLDARLARWLLMANDRMDGDQIAITHEFLSLMLAVRRAGVTTTMASLVDRGCVAIKRGSINILDRASLQRVAANFYGVPEREQLRLTGWQRKH